MTVVLIAALWVTAVVIGVTYMAWPELPNAKHAGIDPIKT
jgi:hypothetical protein